MPGYLVHDDYGYSIELAGITSAAQMLDWIYQIRSKGWTADTRTWPGCSGRSMTSSSRRRHCALAGPASSCPRWTSPGG